jgi:hypothetical protein
MADDWQSISPVEIAAQADSVQSTGESHAYRDDFSIAGCCQRLYPLVDEFQPQQRLP